MVDRRKKRYLIEKAKFKEELILKEQYSERQPCSKFFKKMLQNHQRCFSRLSTFRVIKKMKNIKMLS
jgi:hypothetical protein